MENDLKDACSAEVVDLHRFIEQWLTGSAPRSREVFARFDEALANDFVIVHPSGIVETGRQVAAGFWEVHGAHEQPFAIEIRNLKHRLSFADFALVTYEEWQLAEEDSVRCSSALFRRSARASGVEWVHLHETWLPTGEP